MLAENEVKGSEQDALAGPKPTLDAKETDKKNVTMDAVDRVSGLLLQQEELGTAMWQELARMVPDHKVAHWQKQHQNIIKAIWEELATVAPDLPTDSAACGHAEATHQIPQPRDHAHFHEGASLEIGLASVADGQTHVLE